MFNKLSVGLAVGVLVGVYVGMTKEEELDDYCHKIMKSRKKIMRKINHMQDYFE